MSARGNMAATEASLRRFAKLARERDVPLVYGAFDTDIHGGLCVLGAYNRFSGGEDLALPDGDGLSAAWDAIEHGWDGEPRRTSPGPRTWWALGRRLRRSFRPRKARTEAPRKRPTRRGAEKVRFT